MITNKEVQIYNIKYSVVIPVYNSGDWLAKLVKEISEILNKENERFEIILVNDGSSDKSTWNTIKKICDKNKCVKAIDLQYNAGQFNAVLCGMKYSKGEFVITMDDDFQHLPSEIPKLIRKMEEKNCDCVIGSYLYKEHNFFRKAGSVLVGQLEKKIYHKPKNIQSTSFRILKKQFVQVLLNYSGKKPQVGPMIFLSAKEVETVIVKHNKREYGKSGYRPMRLLNETFNVVINSSTFPLDVVTWGGFIVAGLSFLIGFVYLLMYFAGKIRVPGFTAQILVTTFFSGVILLSLGIVGKYVGHIVRETVGFPAYMVREMYRCSDEEDKTE